jgi:hypothetical protein
MLIPSQHVTDKMEGLCYSLWWQYNRSQRTHFALVKSSALRNLPKAVGE